MKYTSMIFFFSLFCFLCSAQEAPNEVKAPEKSVENKRLPGLKLSYTNSVILQQLIRTQIDRKSKAEKVQVTLVCEKKYSVRGRDSAKSYLCQPQGLADLSEK